ncbi:recombinase family protein [Glutamicibacter sp. TV12E]|uniref:recombinase family protein n=1 Tax=Glutamicibacter sp. TV12E TaxID=3446362 RepID=UPI004034A7EA
MSTTSRPRAILYLRQSIAREESISLDLQEDAGRRYAEQQGYTVVAVKADEGISGRTWNRKAVKEVMAMVETGEADIIVLWKWSRLSRARLDWAIALDKVEAAGGRIESATEQVDVSTSTGRFARGMLAEFAVFESERIGDTWKESQARRVAQGRPHSGIYRFGYIYDKATGYTPDPIAGPILVECYRRYNRGESLSQLLAYVVSTGVPSSTRTDANNWNTSRISQMLKSPFAAGYFTYNGKTYQGDHEPLITTEEWEAYLVNRAARQGTRKPRAPRNPYTGLLVCTRCDHKMYQHDKHDRATRYMCSGAQTKKLHKGGSIHQSKIDRAVLAWFKERIADEADAAAREAARKTPALPATNTTATIRRALIKEQSRLDSLTAKYVDDVIPQASYEKLRDESLKKIEAFETRLRELRVQQHQTRPKVDPKLLEAWPHMHAAEKQQILGLLVDHIEVTPGHGAGHVAIVPKWAVPTSQ